MENEELFKEIDLIQNCISRMTQNSFMLKGWALTIFAGVTVFTKGDNFSSWIMMSCSTLLPFICFWILDAYFLKTERKYRKLYSDVLKNRKLGNTENQYELNIKNIKEKCILKTMFSATLLVFYGIPSLCIVGVFLMSILSNY